MTPSDVNHSAVHACITNIQRFSLDDGPGIRTTVFFKGCPLNCRWCHNPECIDAERQLEFLQRKCTMCGACVNVCKQAVHHISGDIHTIAFERCVCCGMCTDTCTYGALNLVGTYYRADTLVPILLQDQDFYIHSNGGVTFSGGEPLLHSRFLEIVMAVLKERGIHLAIDTCGFVPREAIERVSPFADLFLYDIKAYDSGLHKKLTGVGNEQIWSNLQYITEERSVPVIIRMPLVSGLNDDPIQLELTADRLANMRNILMVELLKYHQYGISKYEAIGREYTGMDYHPPTNEAMAQVVSTFKRKGLNACCR